MRETTCKMNLGKIVPKQNISVLFIPIVMVWDLVV